MKDYHILKNDIKDVLTLTMSFLELEDELYELFSRIRASVVIIFFRFTWRLLRNFFFQKSEVKGMILSMNLQECMSYYNVGMGSEEDLL